jgi:hypothetical protein
MAVRVAELEVLVTSDSSRARRDLSQFSSLVQNFARTVSAIRFDPLASLLSAVPGLPQVGTGPAIPSQMVALDANIAPFLSAVAEATSVGSLFAATPFKATLDANTSPFVSGVAQATSTGSMFAVTPFTAILDGNRSAFVSSVAEATSAGLLFAQNVFTATLNAIDNASWVIASVANALAVIPTSVTTTINTVLTTTTVPGRAGGGTVREPFTLVGEDGPEIVSLPWGSRVHTAAESRGMRGGSGQGDTYITFGPGSYVGPGAMREIEQLATRAAVKVIDQRNFAGHLARRTG